MIDQRPDPPAEARGAAVELVPVLVRDQSVEFAVEAEARALDPVGVAADDGSEIRRVGDVILDAVEAEDNPLRSARSRHDEVAQHRAPRNDPRLGARPRSERDFENVVIAQPAEAFDRHLTRARYRQAARGWLSRQRRDALPWGRCAGRARCPLWRCKAWSSPGRRRRIS